MRLKDILARSLVDYKNNPVLVLPRIFELLFDLSIALIVVLIWGSLFGFTILTSYTGLSFKILALGFVAFSVTALLMLLATASVRAALVAMALKTYHGDKAYLGDGVQGAKTKGLQVFLYFIFLIGVMLSLWSGVIVALSIFPPLVFISIPVAILVFLGLYFLTFLTPQQIVVRNCGVIQGIRSSASFVMNNYTKVLGYFGFFSLLAFGIWLLPFLVFFIINEVTRYHPFLNLAAGIFHNLLSLALGIVVSPYLEMVKTYMVVGETHGRERDRENKKEEAEGNAGESKTPGKLE